MKKKNVIYGLLIFVLIFFIFSCGSRKVNKSHSKEQVQTETIDKSTTEKKTDSNVKTTANLKVYDKNETVIEETITEPVDASKESFLIEKDGSKVILNNAKKIVRKTTQKNNAKTELFGNSEQLKKESVKEEKAVNNKITSKKENKSKAIDKKQFNPFESLWLIIPLGIIYWAYRKYKNLPLVPKF
jgi:hypothetical protein